MNDWILYVICLVVIIGLMGYVFYQKTLEHRLENQRLFADKQQNINAEFMLQKLQAYERLAIFLERIKPISMVRRINAEGSAVEYQSLILATIQQEWEHNLSQQIYIHPETWKMIYSAKNATQALIKQLSAQTEESTAKELQEKILNEINQHGNPSDGVLLKLQADIQQQYQ